MARTTRAHIDAELSRLILTAQRLGLKGRAEEWVLLAGSVQYKEPWRLFYKDRKMVLPVAFLPEGVIGANATEVISNIRTIRSAWEYVYQNREK